MRAQSCPRSWTTRQKRAAEFFKARSDENRDHEIEERNEHRPSRFSLLFALSSAGKLADKSDRGCRPLPHLTYLRLRLLFVIGELTVVVEQDPGREQAGTNDADEDEGKCSASFSFYQRDEGQTGCQSQHHGSDKCHNIRCPMNLFHHSPFDCCGEAQMGSRYPCGLQMVRTTIVNSETPLGQGE